MGGAAGVDDGIAARVAATACCIRTFGSGVGVFGEQAAVRSRIKPRLVNRSVCLFILKIIHRVGKP